MLTIQIPPDLEQQLTQLATQHNLTRLYRALADVKTGWISPVETLWDDNSAEAAGSQPGAASASGQGDGGGGGEGRLGEEFDCEGVDYRY